MLRYMYKRYAAPSLTHKFLSPKLLIYTPHNSVLDHLKSKNQIKIYIFLKFQFFTFWEHFEEDKAISCKKIY